MKTAVFIDGGHLRVLVRQDNREYVPNYIENVALACVEKDEFFLRILYYDCAPYQGNPRLPVSGNRANFQGSDEDFKPQFEQKGVDMRIGLDIATYAVNRSLDRIILITGDTDCLPAMKLARSAGLQVILVQFPKQHLARELLSHSDFQRQVKWPD